MPQTFLIYGSYGYTGALIARLAVERGLRPILAGRNAGRLAAQAGELGLPQRAFALDDRPALDEALAHVAAVLHCAGPFSRTSRPMAEGCLRSGVHYLDITGEIAVFEALAARSAAAQAAGVMLLPGVGFDVAPSDCLAAHLKARLPSATHLILALRALSSMSRGTATTMVENLHRPGLVRRAGRLTPVPAGWKTRLVDFGRGPVECVTIPWGDVSTAYYSTAIPNIEVYVAAPAALRRLMAASRYLVPLLAAAPVQALLKMAIRAGPPGPSDQQRAQGLGLLWGQVTDDAGQTRTARLRTPEAYTLTALTGLAIVERVLAGQAPAGFQTPSLAYGADFILEIEGVAREDVD